MKVEETEAFVFIMSGSAAVAVAAATSDEPVTVPLTGELSALLNYPKAPANQVS